MAEPQVEWGRQLKTEVGNLAGRVDTLTETINESRGEIKELTGKVEGLSRGSTQVTIIFITAMVGLVGGAAYNTYNGWRMSREFGGLEQAVKDQKDQLTQLNESTGRITKANDDVAKQIQAMGESLKKITAANDVLAENVTKHANRLAELEQRLAQIVTRLDPSKSREIVVRVYLDKKYFRGDKNKVLKFECPLPEALEKGEAAHAKAAAKIGRDEDWEMRHSRKLRDVAWQLTARISEDGKFSHIFIRLSGASEAINNNPETLLFGVPVDLTITIHG